MPKKHWTPRYIRDRIGLWLFQRRNPGLPWLTADAIRILDDMIGQDDIGLEWGSGRSTIWFARRVRHLTSVETDEAWYRHVRERILKEGYSHIDYRYEHDETLEAQSRYVRTVEGFSPESLDFVLVDGAAREHCARKALRFIKKGGLLILDNAHLYLPRSSHAPCSRKPSDGPANSEWAAFAEEVRNWRCLWTSNGIFDTALWIKPCIDKKGGEP